jgi:autotransporter-associated beta strand protein
MNRLVKITIMLLFASLGSAAPVLAATTWVGGTPDWETDFNTASNWINDPASETYFSISSVSPVATLNAPSAWAPFDFYVGEFGDGRLDLNAGALLTTGYIAVGTGYGAGTLNMTDASLSTNAYSVIFGFGNAASTPTYSATVNVSGSSTISANTAVLFGMQPEVSGGAACTATIGGSSSITANGSYEIDSVAVGVLVGNGSSVSVSGSSSVTALAGTVMVRDNSTLTLDGTATLYSSQSLGCHNNSVINVNSTGVIPGDVDGCTVRVSDLLAIGFNTENSSGTLNVTAGKVVANGTWLGCWNGSLGSINISGTGTFVTNSAAIGSIAEGLTGVGYVSVKGGTFKATSANDPIYVGVYSDGLVDISAGVMDCTTPSASITTLGDALWVGGIPGVAGIVNVRGTGSITNTTNVIRMRGNGIINAGVAGSPGGILQTAAILPGNQAEYTAANSVVNFHGGTIVATVDADGVTVPEGGTAANPVLIGKATADVGHVYVYAEGAKIDTNGHNVVIDAVLEAPATGGIYSTVSGMPYTIPMFTGGNGSGYVTAPYVRVLDGDGTGPGKGATAIAVMSETNPGEIDHIEITNPGVGYVNPNFTLVGGLSATGIAGIVDFSQVAMDANASGGLTKLGEGVLLLTNAPTYAGDTTVGAGTLVLPSLDTPLANVTVYDGGTLAVGSIVADTLTIGGSAPPILNAVPEPGTLVLMAIGLATIACLCRKRK